MLLCNFQMFPKLHGLLCSKTCIKIPWSSDLVCLESLSSHTLDCHPVSFLRVGQAYPIGIPTDLAAGSGSGGGWN